MLELQVKGLDRLKRDLREMAAELGRKVIDQATRAAARRFANEAKARCSSASVLKSIKVIRLPGEDDPKQYTYIVAAGYRTPAAHLIEFGTKPHRIVPNAKRRKAVNYIAGKTQKRAGVQEGKRAVLRIIDQYAAAANHPGSKQHPFMRPSFDLSQNAAIADFVKTAERNMASMARKGILTGQYWENT